jgi:hypothetical protein
MPTWTRLGSSLVLVVAGWGWYTTLQDAPDVTLTLFFALGMTLGLLGDVFMARLIPWGNPVLLGMAAFGLGHVAYITGGLRFFQQIYAPPVGNAPSANLNRFLAAWAIWLVIGLFGWYVVVFRGQQHSAMSWAALPYALLLASTAGVATGLSTLYPPFILTAVGAGLFLFSDLMIAAKLFAGRSLRRISIDDVIWLTYGPGQMLIVYTPLWLALRVILFPFSSLLT